MSVFAEWQPEYAARGIPTFPVGPDKVPAISHFNRVGLPGSRRLADKFGGANALGFLCKPAGVVVVDVDSPCENALAEAYDEFGHTPLVIRSGSGNHQLWYKRENEGRHIRPSEGRPIDILGDGFVVAPPSEVAKGCYSFIQGSLDDLPSLPPLKGLSGLLGGHSADPAPMVEGGKVGRGQRNDSLWRRGMQIVRECGTFDELMIQLVEANNTMFTEPLPQSEVARIAASVWGKQADGSNWYGAGQVVAVSFADIDGLMQIDPDAFLLLLELRRHHWGRAFVVANKMAETMPGGGWPRKKFAAARARLESFGAIEMIRPPSRQNGPAVYQFKGGRF